MEFPLVRGAVFSRYKLLEPLGAGGWASVWKAWDNENNRPVAIKFFHSLKPGDSGLLLREAELVKSLEHPGIVPVYETGHLEGTTYVVMKFVEGQTLDTATLSLEAKVKAIRDAALVLDHAHAHGIIHRDIKPDNILIEGSGGQVFVADFGLAKHPHSKRTISSVGSVLGTAPYMPPEQARGHSSDVDARSDVYSLGATLYELVTGRPPFEGKDFMEVVVSVVRDDVTPPKMFNPQLPPQLDTIILKALEKDPVHRYASAKEFADDLQRYLDGAPVAAVTDKFARTVRKNRGTWLLVLLALILVLLLVGYYLYSRLSLVSETSAPTLATLEQEAQKAQRDQQASETYLECQRELHLLRARSYRADWRLELDGYEKLIERCREQMKKTGESPDAWWIIGRALHLLGNSQEAEKAFEAGLKLRPDHPWCLLYQGRISIEGALNDRFREGRVAERDALAARKIDDALALMRKALSTGDVREIELDLTQGYAMVVRKQPTADFCDRMLTKWKGHDFREEFYLIRGLSGRLIEDATIAIAARPGFFEAYYWRAAGQTDARRRIEDLSKAIEIHPRYWQAYDQRGMLRLSLDDLNCAIDINPNVPELYVNRGSLRKAAGDPKGALADCNKALELAPRFTEAYNNRGAIYYESGDDKRAIEDYSKAIEIHPQRSEAWCNRSIARTQSGDALGGIDDANEALRLNPNYALAFMNRATAKEMLKQPAEAEKDYTQAIQLNDKLVEARFLRGRLRVEQGRYQEAITDLEKVGKNYDAPALLKQCKSKLNREY